MMGSKVEVVRASPTRGHAGGSTSYGWESSGKNEPVMLGYIGDRAYEEDIWTSKIGGAPFWIDVPAPESYYRCPQCGKQMHLVAQAYAPLPLHSDLDRVLYLFSCNSEGCNNEKNGPARCWRILRCQIPAVQDDLPTETSPSAPTSTATSQKADTDDWGAGGDDWGAGGDDWSAGSDWLRQTKDEDLEKLLETSLTISDNTNVSSNTGPTSSKPSKEQQNRDQKPQAVRQPGTAFFGFYMEVEEEVKRSIVGKKEKKLAAQWAKELNNNDEDELEFCGGKGGKGGKDNRKGKARQKGGDDIGLNEDYEESEDKHLLKFQEYLERNPEHVFRYSFGGRPLWMSKDIPQSVPVCERCGAERVFECEVMPTLIYLLRSAQENEDDATRADEVQLEFGCVAVFSCSNSCGPAGEYSYEYAYLQQAL